MKKLNETINFWKAKSKYLENYIDKNVCQTEDKPYYKQFEKIKDIDFDGERKVLLISDYGIPKFKLDEMLYSELVMIYELDLEVYVEGKSYELPSKLLNFIRQADEIILLTNIHNSTMSAMMKNFIDHIPRELHKECKTNEISLLVRSGRRSESYFMVVASILREIGFSIKDNNFYSNKAVNIFT